MIVEPEGLLSQTRRTDDGEAGGFEGSCNEGADGSPSCDDLVIISVAKSFLVCSGQCARVFKFVMNRCSIVRV